MPRDEFRIRLPRDLAEHIRQIAAENHRSINGEIAFMLEQAYRAEKRDD